MSTLSTAGNLVIGTTRLTGKAAWGTTRFTGKAAWGTTKAAARVATGVTKATTAASAAGARALLGGTGYLRTAEEVNQQIEKAFAVADAALTRRDAYIATLEARLDQCRCSKP